MKKLGHFLLTMTLSAGLAACDGNGGDSATAPEAPTSLKGEILEGGVHLTWVDASDDEDNFIVERMMKDHETTYTKVVELPFDTVTYHDTGVESGMTYMFRVQAVNSAGEASSNEFEIAVP